MTDLNAEAPAVPTELNAEVPAITVAGRTDVIAQEAKLQTLNSLEADLDQFVLDGKAQLQAMREQVKQDATAHIVSNMSDLTALNVFAKVTPEYLKNRLTSLQQKHNDFHNMMLKSFEALGQQLKAAVTQDMLHKVNIPEWADVANAFETAWNTPPGKE